MTDDNPPGAPERKGRGRGALHLGETHDLPGNAPKDAAVLEFGRRLQKLMIERGWTQSETARQAQIHMPKGKQISRDAMSKYVNGLSLPSPTRLSALANAFKVEQKDLVPHRSVSASAQKLQPIDVQSMEDGTAWLRINQAVPWPTAVKILALLKGEE